MYDPTDESVDALYATLLQLVRAMPDNLGKQVMARLFEESALRQVLLELGKPLPVDEEGWAEAYAEHWDRIEEIRNDHAANFLNAVQREEF
jgi:hypothetical protein